MHRKRRRRAGQISDLVLATSGMDHEGPSKPSDFEVTVKDESSQPPLCTLPSNSKVFMVGSAFGKLASQIVPSRGRVVVLILRAAAVCSERGIFYRVAPAGDLMIYRVFSGR